MVVASSSEAHNFFATMQTGSAGMPILAPLPSPKPSSIGLGSPAPSSMMRSDAGFDVPRLMEVVRQEVTLIMQDSVSKAASFCASQCAKHVVAARRELHQKLLEQKSEHERLHGQRFGGLSPATSTGAPTPTPGAGATPGSTAFAINTPVSNATPRKAVMPGIPPLAPGAFSRDSGMAAAHSAMTPLSARSGNVTPLVTGFDEMACVSYDAYIGVHDAVQTLEERTKMAVNAMEAIEKAINLPMESAQATNSQAGSGTPVPQSVGARVAQAANSLPSSQTDHGSNGALPGFGSEQRSGAAARSVPPVSTHACVATKPAASEHHWTALPPNTSDGSRSGASASSNTARTAGPATAESATRVIGNRGESRRHGGEVQAPPSSSVVRIAPGDLQHRKAEGVQREERQAGQAKFREHSLASTFSEAESIAPAHLAGY